VVKDTPRQERDFAGGPPDAQDCARLRRRHVRIHDDARPANGKQPADGNRTAVAPVVQEAEMQP